MTALAHAALKNCGVGEEQKEAYASAAESFKAAFYEHPSFDVLVRALISGGVDEVSKIKAAPGVPVMPMLGKISRSMPTLVSSMHEHGASFKVDFKYDGMRCQVHVCSSGHVELFSRHRKRCTERFPDVVEAVRRNFKGTSCILDAEVVAVEASAPGEFAILPFQRLTHRTKTSANANEIPACLYIFDIMSLDGESLLNSTLEKRHKVMIENFDTEAGALDFASFRLFRVDKVAEDETLGAFKAFFNDALKARCEGVMVKELKSTYQPSKRCESWTKIKKDYIESAAGDTLDLVPIGAWYGNGRKAGWYSPFLLAAWNADEEVFESVCKVMSGFTDSFYKEQTALYQGDNLLECRPGNVSTGLNCSVWFKPQAVWEIKCADFTLSPIHRCAVGYVGEDPTRGVSMRFPRFIRIREDLTPFEGSTTPVEIAEMYERQND